MRRPRANTSAIALFALLLSCCFAWPAGAGAESSGVLAPELAELANPAVRSQPLEAQAEALGFPTSGPGSLQRDGSQVAVELEFGGGAVSALPALREAGATITAASRIYQRVNAVVSPADLHALAALPGVTGVEPVRTPILYAPETSVSSTAICEGGTVLSEGIDQLGIVTQPGNVGVREAFGTRGAGVTIGVLSDSYDVATTIDGSGTAIPTHAAEDIQSNNLTGAENNCSGQQMSVNVLEDGPAGSHDEGRAMLQIVHDIAPHANLAFATAFNGELSFAQNIERLAAPVSAGGAGAKVIVDDVSYFEEPMFQDGPVAAAVAKVTAAGVTYLSSAGNNHIGAANGPGIGSWETPQFRDTLNPADCPIPVGVAARRCLDFDPNAGEDNTFGITIEKGVPIRLAVGWSEPWYGTTADLDAYLLRYVPVKLAKVPGETEVVSLDNRGNVNGKPAAFVAWQNTEPPETPGETEEVMLVINRCFGNACDPEASSTAKPRLKLILLQSGAPVVNTEYEESEGGDVVGPTIFGHNGTASAISVGASSFSSDGVHINAEGIPEDYSSHGPETHYYGPVLSSTPAAKLATPEVVEKPDVVATDCGANTFFRQYYLGFWRFCGTSAAAAHAAAVIALMHQANPAKTPAQLKSALKATAKPVSGYGSSVVGGGLVRARQAVEALAPLSPFSDPPSTVIAPAPPAPPTPDVPIVNPTPAPTANPGATGVEPGSKTATPTTKIKKHPPKLVKTSRVGRTKLSFKFATDQKGASFECSVDKSGWSKCGSNYNAYFLSGSHELKVRARGSDGKVDPIPAVFKFTIKLVAFFWLPPSGGR
jgi:Subtilase family